MMKRLLQSAGVIALAFAANSANAAVCVGNCGTSGADGVVTLSPTGNANYSWISTSGGDFDSSAGEIDGVSDGDAGANSGSQFTSTLFSAAAGDNLTFYFNYVTSDGSGFSDYAWTELLDTSLAHVAWLFTARTQATGDTSPGFGLPANDATLDPATTPIIDGGPAWSPLGDSSGQCFDGVGNGCGYTGWIKSSYSIGAAGDYYVRYGVTNWNDSSFDSGLAFDGLAVNDIPVEPGAVPEPSTWAMMLLGFGIVGGAMRRRNRQTVRVAYN